MNRGNYDVHNAFFEGGGPWGVIQSVLAAYVEERTGRSFHTFFDVLSGASIGGVNAIVLSLGIPAKDLAHATYACSVDLFRCTSTRLFMKQFIRSTTGISVGMDHFDHMVLYETLAPYLAPYRLKDARTGLLAGAHNMEFKKNIWFLQLDEDLFDITQMKMPAFNGETPMLDAAMAGTAIHGVFHPWLYNDHHYRDAASLIAPGQVTLELHSCLKARQKLLRSEHRPRSAPIAPGSFVPEFPHAGRE